jgi:hypothetical protein
LNTVQKWFEIEQGAKKSGLIHVQRRDVRCDIMKKEFADFKAWMIQQAPNHLPKSPTRKAIDYALGQWDGFDAFFEDGRVELSNNLVENAIRPVAVGGRIICLKDLNLRHREVLSFIQL